MMSISLCRNAFVQLLKVINREYDTVYNFNLLNQGRHSLMKPVDVKQPTFYSLYKKDFFNSFGKMYPDEPSGVGESINVEWLELALGLKVDFLMFVYSNGYAYRISPKIVKRYCESRGLVRDQDCGESTYVFPIMMLERVGD